MQKSPLDYVPPVVAVLLVILGAWWYYGLLKQRSHGKILEPPRDELRINVPPGAFKR